MKTIRGTTGVRRVIARWRDAGDRIVLVPTMGNLHAGHLRLMERARREGERVVASIFVNPTQFGPHEDFESYPRTPARDRRLLRDAGVDLLFTPDVRSIYPNGPQEATAVAVPGLSNILCGAVRPGHFEGVTSVCCRLFNMVAPDSAVFGKKDYQQLVIIRRMVVDLHLPVRIVGVATGRAPDGLALSSRNQYLSAAQRARAPALYAALRECARGLRAGRRDLAGLIREGQRALRAAGFRPDYFEIRRAGDLAVPGPGDHKLVVLAAGRLGKARLIDNVTVRR